MKKLFFIILLAMSGAFSVTSCTEEHVEPTVDNGGVGSGGGDQGGKL